MLFRSVAESDPLYPAALLLGRIVDDGMSTRLHRRLIDELGLAYYVAASPETFHDCGLFEIEAAVQHKNVEPMVKEALALITGLADSPPTVEELEKSKRRYRWDMEASFDDPDALAGWFGGAGLYREPTSYAERVGRINAVNADDIRRAAQQLRSGGVVVAVVGQLRAKAQEAIEALISNF
jgi:predicted Zn-dependent peptidase